MLHANPPAPPKARPRILVRTGLLLASLIGASTLAAIGRSVAANGPESHPSPTPVDATLVPNLPQFPWSWQPVGPLELRYSDPLGPDDKGSTYTDMGVSGESRLTEREVALLELSRAAVEASRLAGTLGTGAPSGPRTPSDPLAARRLKDEAATHPPVSTPVLGTGGPGDHAVMTVDPSRASAPTPLTEDEAAKLAFALAHRAAIVELPLIGPVTQPEGAPQPPSNGGAPAAGTAQPAGGAQSTSTAQSAGGAQSTGNAQPARKGE